MVKWLAQLIGMVAALMVGYWVGYTRGLPGSICPEGTSPAWTQTDLPEELSTEVRATRLACWTADGELSGPWVDWIEGEMWRAGRYERSQLDGDAVLWGGSRRIYSVGDWKGGIQGGFTNWDEDGKLALNWSYQPDGRAVSRAWHKNGERKNRIEWLNGDPHGAYRAWHDNGQSAVSGSYTHGRRTGIWTCWNRDGKRTAHRDWGVGTTEMPPGETLERWHELCYGSCSKDSLGAGVNGAKPNCQDGSSGADSSDDAA